MTVVAGCRSVPDEDLSVARLGVLAALRQGDAGLAYQLVVGLMDDGYPMPAILDGVLAPIQCETGQRWEEGDATISEEHASTAAIETLVSILGGTFDQPAEADLVVVACAEGDTHSLPARMASAVLAYAGYRTLFLGTSVPADDLAEHLASVGADTLVVSCTRAANLLGARACVAAGHRVGIPVAVGGRAFGDSGDRWVRIGADAHADTLPSLTELLQTWEPSPGLAESRVQPVSPLVEALAANRFMIAGAVADAISKPVVGNHRLVWSTAEELVDCLAVAVYLADADLLAGQARSYASALEGRIGLAVTADQVLSALADAAAVAMPDDGLIDAARQIVDEG
jgi:methanogenic corrinoid protein MtbC1